ncbi:MAG: hypothetical protein ABIR57_00070 [Aeromicrobium sp.]
MITLLIVAVVLIAIISAVAAILPQDGYGHRPAPRSHLDAFPTHQRAL